ncbi:MAG: hypothetical protein JXL84_04770 [Deltaproteobacteria bacterium]|nr:hypothetical protein [Deltaproteobacteria bacterium]
MTTKEIPYPKSWRDIPYWRRRQITQEVSWFRKYSPAQRLDYVDREWRDFQDFIRRFGFQRHGTGK